MSATETWAMDIEEIARQIISDEFGDVVTKNDLDQQVTDALESMDVPTRDDVLSHDDVNEAIYEIINSGNIDVTDMVDADQIADSLSYSYTMKGAVEDWITESDEFIDLVERVNNLSQQVGTEERLKIADRQIKNLTERIVYMEGIINSFVDWADSLGDKGNAALAAIVPDEPDTAPYAAI